ncbi:hypothetical protein ASPVEDRAFT_138896 [Aspergillus versicolor CBS 583.65]|uniref:Uncharacterized protein n=1 Tax=Aspergillus versicolor CBS 583.65 TaxID=1036611 RepID=A0A1L9PVG9_ASPVE|nr:uncharacterized protein ASPVEDRAFT_138896 [Aspergillus versicolor CBS 583.65]OJJ05539.1 hypothetical protein ASPVEDRAFT_138896 [Aspergillus versicolor CBS 583.65]
MVSFSGKATRKLIVAVALSLIVIVVHHLSYADESVLAGELSESVNIINGCSRAALNPIDTLTPAIDPGIPNTIHQIWKTANVEDYSTEIKPSHHAWKTMFEPLNYTVKLWTDDDILNLVKDKYPWLLQTYLGYPHNIQRADIARLLIVHTEGGTYADLDVYPSSAEHIQCLQRLGMQSVFAPTGGTSGLSNHFFMAERASPLLEWALYEAKRRGRGLALQRIVLPYLLVFWSTGPIMLTAAVRKYAWLYDTIPGNIALLDEGYSGAVIRHVAGRSWQGVDGQALNYIADHAGTEVLLRIIAYLFVIVGLVCVIRRYYGRCSTR